jgi:transcriptional regulator with XRE-family HTH domain
VAAGTAVRNARRVRYPSLDDFARATGLSVTVLSQLENGARSNFSTRTTGPIEDALGWQRGGYNRLLRRQRPRLVEDPELHELQRMWPRLSLDARRTLVEVVRHVLAP